MVWIRLDDRFTRHPKILRAGPAAAWLYVCGLAYCAEYLTDGYIPAEAVATLSVLPNAVELAQELVDARTPRGEHGLWEVVEGGFQVHDYSDYQPLAETVRKKKEADIARLRSKRAQAHAAVTDPGERRGAVATTSRRRGATTATTPPTVASTAATFLTTASTATPPAVAVGDPGAQARGGPGLARMSSPAPLPRSAPAAASAERTQASPAPVSTRDGVAATSPRRPSEVAATSAVPIPIPIPSGSQDPNPVCDLVQRERAHASPGAHAHMARSVSIPATMPLGSEDPNRVCDLVPRVPARASSGERASTAVVGGENQREGTGKSAPPEPPPTADLASAAVPNVDAGAGADPDAAAILAHLRAMPEPIRHLATAEHASRFAGARLTGLTLNEIRAAISGAGLKLGPHRGAHPGMPDTIDRLADHVGSFLIHQDRKTSDATPQLRREADQVAVERFLARWCERYQTSMSVAYVVTDEDRVHAAELLDLAHQAAVQEGARTGSEEPGLEARISEHWIGAYLRDEGPAGYLVKARHALRYMRRQVGTYGLPQRPRRLAKCPAPEPNEQPATAEEMAAGAAQVLRACAAVGGGGDRFGGAVPRRPGMPEAS